MPKSSRVLDGDNTEYAQYIGIWQGSKSLYPHLLKPPAIKTYTPKPFIADSQNEQKSDLRFSAAATKRRLRGFSPPHLGLLHGPSPVEFLLSAACLTWECNGTSARSARGGGLTQLIKHGNHMRWDPRPRPPRQPLSRWRSSRPR